MWIYLRHRDIKSRVGVIHISKAGFWRLKSKRAVTNIHEEKRKTTLASFRPSE